MQELETILDVACSVSRCSTKQAKGRSRQVKIAFARFIFFAIATENGTRDYVAVWHLRRDRSIAYHYKKRVARYITVVNINCTRHIMASVMMSVLVMVRMLPNR